MTTIARRLGFVFGMGVRSAWGRGRGMRLRSLLIVWAVMLNALAVSLLVGLPGAFHARTVTEAARALPPAGSLAVPIEPFASDVDLYAAQSFTWYEGQLLTIVSVFSDSNAPPPPDADRLPQPGELVVSPALAKTLRSLSGRAGLADRLPGDVVGIIGTNGLLEPDELYAYVGVKSPAGLERISGWGVADLSGSAGLRGTVALASGLTAVLLLVPLFFVVTAAVGVLSERRRTQMASLVMLGADHRDLLWLQVGETVTLAILGIILGVAAAHSVAGLLNIVLGAELKVQPALVAPNLGRAISTGVALLLVVVGATLVGTRGALSQSISIVRQTRRSTPHRWWIPTLAAGIVAMWVASTHGQAIDMGNIFYLIAGIGGFALAAVSVAPVTHVVAGGIASWLSRHGSRCISVEIAAARFSQNPNSWAGPASVLAITIFAIGFLAGMLPAIGAQTSFLAKFEAGRPERPLVYVELERAPTAALARQLERLGPTATVTIEAVDSAHGSHPGLFGTCPDLQRLSQAGLDDCRPGTVYSRTGGPLGSTISPAGTDTRLPVNKVLRADFSLAVFEGDTILVPTGARQETIGALNPTWWLTVVATTNTESVRDLTWHSPRVSSIGNPYGEIPGGVATTDEVTQVTQEQIAQVLKIILIITTIVLSQAAAGIATLAMASALEQRPTALRLWALGTRSALLTRVQAILHIVPVLLAIVVGGAAGAATGLAYLRFAQPPVGEGSVHFDVGIVLMTAAIAAIATSLLALVVAPLATSRASITELRTE